MKREWIRKELTAEITVGAFIFLVLLVIGYFTIVLSHEQIFRKTYPLTVSFRSVMGLRDGDSVIVRGVPVGRIAQLALTQDGVRVICQLDEPLPIHKNYRISIVQSSILGGRNLEVFPGTPDSPLMPAGEELQGIEPFEIIDEVSSAVREFRAAFLSDGKTAQDLSAAIAAIRQVAERLNRGDSTLGRLLTEDTLHRDLQAAVRDVRDVAGSLKEAADRIRSGEGLLGRLIYDETLYTNITAVAGNLRDLSDRLAEGKGTLGKLLSEDDTLHRDLSEAVASLKTVLGRVEQGEGTIGKLLKDAEIYAKVKDTISEVQAAVDDFRETSPVVSFISILFGAF